MNLLHDQVNREITMLELVRRLENGQIQLPAHQRHSSWNKRRRQRWIARITGRHLDIDAPLTAVTRAVGIFLTYQTTQPEPSPIFLNDGAQRLNASRLYLNDPAEFTGDTPEEAAAFLDACLVSIQHRHYPTDFEAITDFQLINNGTHLTPFEFCKGILTYMPDYTATWEPLLERMHRAVTEQSERVCYRLEAINSQTTQKHLRNNYAMFYRFLVRQAIPGRDMKVGASKIPLDDIEEGRVIETKLREAMLQAGPAAVVTAMDDFINQITALTADMGAIWEELGEKPKNNKIQFSFRRHGIKVTNYRWLLEAGLIGRLINVPHDKWLNFLRLALTKGGSGGRYEWEKETERKTISVSLSAMGKLPTICHIIGSDFATYKPKAQRGKAKAAQIEAQQ